VKGEVLEGPDQGAVGSRVANRGTRVRDIDLSVHRRGARLAVGHTSMLKGVQSVLALVQEEEVVVSLLYRNAQEVEGTLASLLVCVLGGRCKSFSPGGDREQRRVESRGEWRLCKSFYPPPP
jgi:hypothetical protein